MSKESRRFINAVANNNLSLVEEMISKNSLIVNEKASGNSNTNHKRPSFYAFKHLHEEMYRLLISNGAMPIDISDIMFMINQNVISIFTIYDFAVKIGVKGLDKLKPTLLKRAINFPSSLEEYYIRFGLSDQEYQFIISVIGDRSGYKSFLRSVQTNKLLETF